MEGKMMSLQMKEGDIYRWKWADPKRDDYRGFGDYHCKSQIAEYKDGKLRDTFWASSLDGYLNPSDVVLSFLCNVDDMYIISEHDMHYYDSVNIVDTRHSNNPHAPVYVKKGSKRCAATMLESLNEKIKEHEGKISFSERCVERLSEIKKIVQSGDLDNVYF